MKSKCNYTLFVFSLLLYFISLTAGCGSSSGFNPNGGGQLSTADTATTVAIYKFDEASGSNAINTAQNRYNGSIYGASRVTGKVANALQFGSAGSRVEIPMMPSAMAFPNGEISIDAWIKLDTITPGSFNQLIGSGYWGLKSFCLGLDSGQIQFSVYDGSAWRIVIVSNQTLTANTWYYIALTYNGSSGMIYVNGVEDATNTISYPVPTSYNTLYIGAGEDGFDFTYEFQGIIDEMRVFRTALSASQISDYYSLTK